MLGFDSVGIILYFEPPCDDILPYHLLNRLMFHGSPSMSRFNCKRNDPGYRRGYRGIHCYIPHPCHSGSDCMPKSSPPSPNPGVRGLP